MKIRKIERLIGSPFRNQKLLAAALTHPSYPAQQPNLSAAQHFQRLEFLGDSVLNLFIAEKLYRQLPGGDEGLMSRLRSILVSRKLLALIARRIGLRSELLLGERERRQPVFALEKIMADAYEALIAAIFLDRGRQAAERFLLKCFRPYWDQKKLFRIDPNPKSSLQEHSQKRLARLPIYRSRRNRDGSFTAWVNIKPSLKAEGKGRTKQEAESQAAGALLKRLRSRKKTRAPKGTASTN